MEFRILLASAAVLLSLPGLAREFPSVRFHTVSDASYYGGIHSIAKDSVGRIWFSGAEAVFVYDGSSFADMTGRITGQERDEYWSMGHLATDGVGNLYVSTNQGLQQLDYRRHVFDRVLDGNIGPLTSSKDGSLWMVRDGSIWSRTEEGVYREYPFPSGMDVPPATVGVFSSDGRVFVSSGGSLFRLDPLSGAYRLFSSFPDSVADVLVAGEETWVLTMYAGLFRCTAEGVVITHFPMPSESGVAGNSKQLFLDRDGFIWVACQHGLLLLDPQDGESRLMRTRMLHQYSLPNNSVWAIFQDPDGEVWIGTYGGKLAYVTAGDSDVDVFPASPGGLGHPIVSCFAEDPDGNLYIGTEGGGITFWDRTHDRFRYYVHQESGGLNSNMVKSLQWDGAGRLLVSMYNGGIQLFDTRTERFSDLLPQGSPVRHVYKFVPDGRGGGFLSDPDAPLRHLSSGRSVDVVLTDSLGRSGTLRVEDMLMGKDSLLYLATRSGLSVVRASDCSLVENHRIASAPFAVNNLCCMAMTADGSLYLGSRGGGMNRLDKDGGYEHCMDCRGGSLDGRSVFNIQEWNNTLWISTDDGLFCYDVPADSLYRPEVGRLARCGTFYIRSGFKTREGELLFGGTDGFILFDPSGIRRNPVKPRSFFTGLSINDVPVSPEQLYEAVHTPVKLSHKQSGIAVSFSSDSYLHPEDNRFAFRMSGLSDNWSELSPGERTVHFSALHRGRYRLEVKAANNNGVWGEEPAAMVFIVKPSPFQSVLAWFIYLALFLSAVWFVWKYFTDRKFLQQELELEREKERNMGELTQARIHFFTNISHDLKTPLSLVVDPLKQLQKRVDPASEAGHYALLVEKNVRRIQRMISQLLTFRQIESEKITLDRKDGEFIGFLRAIFTLFEPYAARKDFKMHFSSSADFFYSRFDQDVIEKIFTNLFSNAVKYASSPGVISVDIDTSGKADNGIVMVRAAVSNTGEGIPEDKRPSLFDAFSQAGNSSEFEASSGLGLAIVKELVTALDGTIDVSSEDKLVTFSVVLPLPEVHASPSREVGQHGYTAGEVAELISELEGDPLSVHGSRKARTVVVIDDNPPIREYLQAHFASRYNVYPASGGEEGVALVFKCHPDVVITDLKMPGMDGYAVCQALRSDERTAMLPIVALSGSTQDKVRALEAGANLFLEKPFDMAFLMEQVESLVKMKDAYRERFSRHIIASPVKLDLDDEEEVLLQKALAHVERNMDNSEYDVDEFVSDMAVGRTVLYRKIKNATGMPIKEFILNVRLRRAAQLLAESDYTIAEISEMTGFVNPKYFSVCFRRHFNCSPKEYRQGV
ncbi:MAG: response regulator [Bacteroidales bacterium]|nr:response regulator [Bacteroidales bacterium]